MSNAGHAIDGDAETEPGTLPDFELFDTLYHLKWSEGYTTAELIEQLEWFIDHMETATGEEAL